MIRMMSTMGHVQVCRGPSECTLYFFLACPAGCSECAAATKDTVQCKVCEYGFFLVDGVCKGKDGFV